MSNVYFISDLHLFHKNICKYRTQFTSTQDHDSCVISGILKTVTKRDTLWVLGDNFMVNDNDEVSQAKKVITEIAIACNWNLKFVLGNHCTDNKSRRDLVRWISQVFEVHSLVKYKRFWLSHHPIHPDELRGKYNIYGHVHTNEIDDQRYVCVCCESVNFKPISLAEIMTRFN